MKTKIIKKIRLTLKALISLYIKQIKKLKTELMVRRICEEEGLSIDQTELIVAVINCESGMDTEAKNVNLNGSVDFGLCQFNNIWYWEKERIIHPDVALNNPEKAVRVMIEQYKKGRIKDWVCFKTGLYRRYL